ncbi:hypothetical protein H3C66_04965 [Patescibacteria group bacterium]|nr:hypothetical protein [Patescibacteria group bacterium]
MRTTVIPAQVTTVEDTIAGSLTLTQIILLILPVLLSTATYALLPQSMTLTTYKTTLIVILFVSFMVLALRIKGRLVVSWITLLSSYVFRPHTFVFDKSTSFCREVYVPVADKISTKTKAIQKTVSKNILAPKSATIDYETLMRNTDLNIRFTSKGLLVIKNYDESY